MSFEKQFLEKALPALKEDPRVLAVIRESRLEEYAALRLKVVGEIGPADREKIAANIGHCLVQFREGEEIVGLYDEPLQRVNLSFALPAEAPAAGEVIWEREEGSFGHRLPLRSSPPNLQAVEDRFWVWVHSGALALARGEIFRLVDILAEIRREVLGPMMAQKHGLEPNGLIGLERIGRGELSALRATIPLYDARSAEISLKEAAKLYVDLRETLATADLVRHRRAEMAAMRFLHEVSDGLTATAALHLV